MRAKKTCVARHPAVAALLPCLLLLIALIALLTSASCVGQKPNASLLANDITKLGFIPGKPVSLPPDFKAQGGKHHALTFTVYTFANGAYTIDEQDRLKAVVLYSSNNLDYEPPNYFTEKQKEEYAKAMEETKRLRDEATLVGPSIPEDQRTTLKFITWRGQDIFSLTEKDILDTYGPPIEPTSSYEEIPGDSAFAFIVGFPKTMHYALQTGPNSEADVIITFKEKGTAEDTVDYVNIDLYENLSAEALTQLKNYPWPGLYPAQGK